MNPADFKPETVKKEELLKEGHRKHLLGIIPIPGTEAPKTGTSSSKLVFRSSPGMKTPYVNELPANQPVTGTFLVSHKEVRQKKSGEPYLSLTLSDRTGELDAKMWDNASEVLDTFERDDFVRVKGLLQVFQNRPQLTIHKIQPVADSEVDAADYFPASKRDREEMFRELQAFDRGNDPAAFEGAAGGHLRGSSHRHGVPHRAGGQDRAS